MGDFTTDTNVRFVDLDDYTNYRFEISARTMAGIGVSATTIARTEEGGKVMSIIYRPIWRIVES